MSAPPTDFAIGDSLTMALTQGVTPWPTTAGAALGRKIINLGLDGDTISGARARYQHLVKLTAQQALHLGRPINSRADIVRLLIGTNNITALQDAATVSAAIIAFAEEVIGDGSRLILSPILPRAGWGGHTEDIQDAVDGTNEALEAWAAAQDPAVVTFLSGLYEALEDPEDPDHILAANGFGDGIHLSEAGQAVVAGEEVAAT